MTPSETEVLKMDMQIKWVEELYEGCLSGKFFGKTGVKIIPLCDFISAQIRLARADERKQAYEDGKNAAVDNVEKKKKSKVK